MRRLCCGARLKKAKAMLFGVKCRKDEIFITHREVLPVMYRFSVDGYGGRLVLLANIDKARLTAYLHDIVPDDGSDMLLVDGRGRLVTQGEARLPPRLRKTTGAACGA